MADYYGEVCSERCAQTYCFSVNGNLAASSASCARIAVALVQFEGPKAWRGVPSGWFIGVGVITSIFSVLNWIGALISQKMEWPGYHQFMERKALPPPK